MALPTTGAGQRCAIYTRKSLIGRSEDKYNSIESQRDICSSYIRSQAHRGWRELTLRYDDVGQSGADLDRPALVRLLGDIERGAIDMVVLYKIDRLTRSLRDFMRLLEVFERNDVGFTSITQSFDTRDTLGRLVLNILLTFAQFEREMLADRIRDKQRAMKARGMWTGGRPPIGYDIEDGRVVLNDAEADFVRTVFARFIEIQNYNQLTKELVARGVTNKSVFKNSDRYGPPAPISCGTVHHILRNPLYINGWPSADGRKAPIVDPETWAAACVIRAKRSLRKVHLEGSPNHLLGILFDSFGRRMTVHDYVHRQCNYRYYISSNERWARKPALRRFRVKASEIETLVQAALTDIFCDRERLRDYLLDCGVHGLELDRLAALGQRAAARFSGEKQRNTAALVKGLVGRIELSRESVALVIRLQQIECLLRTPEGKAYKASHAFDAGREPTRLVRVPVQVVRLERQLHLPDLEHRSGENSDPALIELMDECRHARTLVEVEGLNLQQVADVLKLSSVSAVGRRIRITYLAPDISLAIMEGRQPPALNRRVLLETNIPMDWSLQRRLFGFPEQAPLQMGEARY